MEYEELMRHGKQSFNFAPGEKFNGVEHLLETARKILPPGSYECGATVFSTAMAMYIDGSLNKRRK